MTPALVNGGLPRPIYIAFGANLNTPADSFRAAIDKLATRGVTVMAMSGLWQSPAWPTDSGQPDYINACAKVGYGSSARKLLAELHAVETELGRVRGVRNAARTLDLDLLDYKGAIIEGGDITIPHPRMMARGFVLLPLCQIAPNWTDPHTGEGIGRAISKLPLADIAPMTYLGRHNMLRA